MTIRWGLLAILFGVMLRVMAFDAHAVPRGDVVLDVGVARSLAAGEGFGSGFERGLPKLVGPGGLAASLPPQDQADQHPPLWPLAGSLLVRMGLEPFTALRVLSLLCGLLVLWLTCRMTDRLTEGIPGVPDGLPMLAAGFVAVGFLAIDSSGNGSLYAAQAVGVLGLIELCAAPRPSMVRIGLVLGALQLLNHQCAVLLPFPLFVLQLGARPSERGLALLVGLGGLAVSLICLLPWWFRNAEIFGDPFYSVNSIYFLYRAGVEAVFELHQGTPTLRFVSDLDPLLMLRACLGFVKLNLFYVFTTGLVVWPVLMCGAAAALVPFAGEGLKTSDRRLLGVVIALAMLGSVAVLWPATKLRYLVALQPLVVILAARAFARPPGRGQRWASLAVGLAWLGLLLLTLDDVTSSGENARPVRWMLLAFGGALLFWLPLRLHLRVRGGRCGVNLLIAGILISWVLSSWVAVGAEVRTAYHSTDFATDFFGSQGELVEARDERALLIAHDEALARGVTRVAGPIGLLAWPEPRLLEISKGLPAAMLTKTLEALIDADRMQWVILLLEAARPLLGAAPEIGQLTLGGQLEVVAVVPTTTMCSGALLMRVVDA